MTAQTRTAEVYPAAMAEIMLAVLFAAALFIAEPERLQMVLDRIREVAAWLAE